MQYLLHSVQELLISAIDHDLLIQHGVDAIVGVLEELQDGGIVLVAEVLHVHALCLVDGELVLEDVLVEVVVELLIAVVDAELLEGVGDEGLEAEDVQYTD